MFSVLIVLVWRCKPCAPGRSKSSRLTFAVPLIRTCACAHHRRSRNFTKSTSRRARVAGLSPPVRILTDPGTHCQLSYPDCCCSACACCHRASCAITIDSMAMHNLQSSELLIIDMQHIFADDDSDWQAEGYSAAETNVAALANAWTDRAIWTRFVRDPDEPGAWQEYYERWPAGRLEADDHAWNLTLTPSAGQRVLEAPTFSKWNSQMQSLLEDDTVLVVCGVASDCWCHINGVGCGRCGP